MRSGQTLTLSFPPFTGWIRKLALAYAGVAILRLVLLAFAPSIWIALANQLVLVPTAVMHGSIWQLVTYSFIHIGLFHLLFNVLMLWMFGVDLESDWGSKRFLEFFFFCVVGAALVTILVSYTGVGGVLPTTPTAGASGGIFGVLLAFGILYGNREIGLFPFFFLRFPAKYLVGGLIFIEIYLALENAAGKGDAVAHVAHLGGALFAWLYLRFVPRKGLGFEASERYYSLRNAWHRWKRKQASKKFEVYMRQHDKEGHFDQHGNYVPPDNDKTNGSGSKWVN
jgi:membrane associated rhomboid family serine protease